MGPPPRGTLPHSGLASPPSSRARPPRGGGAWPVAPALVVGVGAGLAGSGFGAVGAALASLVAIVPVVVVLSAMHHRPAREVLLPGVDRRSPGVGERAAVPS